MLSFPLLQAASLWRAPACAVALTQRVVARAHSRSFFSSSVASPSSPLNGSMRSDPSLLLPRRQGLTAPGVARLHVSSVASIQRVRQQAPLQIWGPSPGCAYRFHTDHSSSTDHGSWSSIDKRVFFFDIDNCLYPKSSGIPELMKERIEQYFRDSGIPHDEVETLAYRYYVDYGLAIRGLVEKHPEIDVRDYNDKVDGALPLERVLKKDPAVREMILSMNVGKKWLFTNAGESHAKRVISILGLDGVFQGMTFCDHTHPRFVCKPDQKAFEKAMREAGVQDPSLCYFVDDSLPNIERASAVGWTAVHVEESLPADAKAGSLRIRSVLDLPSVLPQFWAREA